MFIIGDSSAVLEFERMLPQHQAAITLLSSLLQNPQVDKFYWLDLACGKGQIISQLNENLTIENRKKIIYHGYDINVDYLKELNKRIHLSPPAFKETVCYNDYKENIMRAIKDKEFLDSMNYRDFENIIYEYLKAQNLPIIYQGKERDTGYDFLIPKYSCVVEVKKYNRNGKISLSVIRTVLGIMVENNANKGIIISSMEFIKPAINFVQNLEQDMVLLSLQDLINFDGNFEFILNNTNNN